MVSIRAGKCCLLKSCFRKIFLWRLCIEDPFETYNSHCPHDLGCHFSQAGHKLTFRKLERALVMLNYILTRATSPKHDATLRQDAVKRFAILLDVDITDKETSSSSKHMKTNNAEKETANLDVKTNHVTNRLSKCDSSQATNESEPEDKKFCHHNGRMHSYDRESDEVDPKNKLRKGEVDNDHLLIVQSYQGEDNLENGSRSSKKALHGERNGRMRNRGYNGRGEGRGSKRWNGRGRGRGGGGKKNYVQKEKPKNNE